jgi:ArsR family transcriptional regulator
MTPDALFQALSDPTRLRIAALLLLADELCVCDLTAVLSLSQPKISRHLAYLREAGLVSDRRAGVWVHYRLHASLPAWVRDVLEATLAGCAKRPPYRDDRARLRQRPLAAAQRCDTRASSRP